MVSNLRIMYGSVQFETDGAMTIEDVSNLARAGQIAGIPATAIVTQMSFYWAGEKAQISIGWSIPNA